MMGFATPLNITVRCGQYTEGFTHIEDSPPCINLQLSEGVSDAAKLHLLLHELAHFITGRGHSKEWWIEAERLYLGFGVLDKAMEYEYHYAELWKEAQG